MIRLRLREEEEQLCYRYYVLRIEAINSGERRHDSLCKYLSGLSGIKWQMMMTTLRLSYPNENKTALSVHWLMDCVALAALL